MISVAFIYAIGLYRTLMCLSMPYLNLADIANKISGVIREGEGKQKNKSV